MSAFHHGRVDTGKVSLRLPAAALTPSALDDARALADRIDRRLKADGLGSVRRVAPIDYEPFAEPDPRRGRHWIGVDLHLDAETTIGALCDRLLRDGVPPGSDLVYTDRGRMCGLELTASN